MSDMLVYAGKSPISVSMLICQGVCMHNQSILSCLSGHINVTVFLSLARENGDRIKYRNFDEGFITPSYKYVSILHD